MHETEFSNANAPICLSSLNIKDTNNCNVAPIPITKKETIVV